MITVACAVLCLVFSAIPAGAAPPSPPFKQCPAIGVDTSCEILIVVNQNGTVTALQDPSQPPYDASEDTLLGVQNDSSFNLSMIHLSGVLTQADPFAPYDFDGDGICTNAPPFPGMPAGCPFGPTGYEGPGTSFANISADKLSGDVVFTNGLAPGASAYFSLEGTIQVGDLTIKLPPLPPTCPPMAQGPELWPPNHKLVNVTIAGVTDPNGDPVTINVTGVTQDEPTNGLGDGDTPIDAFITPNSPVVQIRAERSGLGDGRVYVIHYTATDTTGLSCQGTSTVTVPHDQKPGHVAIDSGQNYDSTK
jgi:hypothetical protein